MGCKRSVGVVEGGWEGKEKGGILGSRKNTKKCKEVRKLMTCIRDFKKN